MSASTSQLRPVSPEIERCYLGRTTKVHSAGHLAVVLAIAKHGTLDRLSVKTPGIASRVGKQIESCIRETVMTLPKQQMTTAATVPYFFQRTAALHAGPQFSWFDVVGYHTKN